MNNHFLIFVKSGDIKPFMRFDNIYQNDIKMSGKENRGGGGVRKGTPVINPGPVKPYWKSEYKIFPNSPDSNTTNIVKDILTIPTKDIHKK